MIVALIAAFLLGYIIGLPSTQQIHPDRDRDRDELSERPDNVEHYRADE